ncbi:hypothetical protein O3P69_018688 [Scylla paramamosain]|uniref:Uncharacterized protein n=1 Tax=Scylla paramamosain TaxID=85552 RepID=A0AAW0SSF6_SCYPA
MAGVWWWLLVVMVVVVVVGRPAGAANKWMVPQQDSPGGSTGTPSPTAPLPQTQDVRRSRAGWNCETLPKDLPASCEVQEGGGQRHPECCPKVVCSGGDFYEYETPKPLEPILGTLPRAQDSYTRPQESYTREPESYNRQESFTRNPESFSQIRESLPPVTGSMRPLSQVGPLHRVPESPPRVHMSPGILRPKTPQRYIPRTPYMPTRVNKYPATPRRPSFPLRRPGYFTMTPPPLRMSTEVILGTGYSRPWRGNSPVDPPRSLRPPRLPPRRPLPRPAPETWKNEVLVSPLEPSNKRPDLGQDDSYYDDQYEAFPEHKEVDYGTDTPWEVSTGPQQQEDLDYEAWEGTEGYKQDAYDDTWEGSEVPTKVPSIATRLPLQENLYTYFTDPKDVKMSPHPYWYQPLTTPLTAQEEGEEELREETRPTTTTTTTTPRSITTAPSYEFATAKLNPSNHDIHEFFHTPLDPSALIPGHDAFLMSKQKAQEEYQSANKTRRSLEPQVSPPAVRRRPVFYIPWQKNLNRVSKSSDASLLQEGKQEEEEEEVSRVKTFQPKKADADLDVPVMSTEKFIVDMPPTAPSAVEFGNLRPESRLEGKLESLTPLENTADEYYFPEERKDEDTENTPAVATSGEELLPEEVDGLTYATVTASTQPFVPIADGPQGRHIEEEEIEEQDVGRGRMKYNHNTRLTQHKVPDMTTTTTRPTLMWSPPPFRSPARNRYPTHTVPVPDNMQMPDYGAFPEDDHLGVLFYEPIKQPTTQPSNPESPGIVGSKGQTLLTWKDKETDKLTEGVRSKQRGVTGSERDILTKVVDGNKKTEEVLTKEIGRNRQREVMESEKDILTEGIDANRHQEDTLTKEAGRNTQAEVTTSDKEILTEGIQKNKHRELIQSDRDVLTKGREENRQQQEGGTYWGRPRVSPEDLPYYKSDPRAPHSSSSQRYEDTHTYEGSYYDYDEMVYQDFDYIPEWNPKEEERDRGEVEETKEEEHDRKPDRDLKLDFPKDHRGFGHRHPPSDEQDSPQQRQRPASRRLPNEASPAGPPSDAPESLLHPWKLLKKAQKERTRSLDLVLADEEEIVHAFRDTESQERKLEEGTEGVEDSLEVSKPSQKSLDFTNDEEKAVHAFRTTRPMESEPAGDAEGTKEAQEPLKTPQRFLHSPSPDEEEEKHLENTKERQEAGQRAQSTRQRERQTHSRQADRRTHAAPRWTENVGHYRDSFDSYRTPTPRQTPEDQTGAIRSLPQRQTETKTGNKRGTNAFFNCLGTA